ncbi:hypothetical protein MASR1M8_12500 [Thermomonas brevis]
MLACLRYDLAIPLPRSSALAANLLVLAVGLVICVFVLLTLVAGVAVVKGWDEALSLGNYIWVVPLGVAFAGLYSAAQLWASRLGWYGLIAKTRLAQMGGGVAIQLLLGIVNKSPLGLILGHAASGGIGSIHLLRRAWHTSPSTLRRVRLRTLRLVLRRYASFPKYSIIDGLSTNAATQLPILLIAAWASGPEAGYLLLATKIVAAPVQMVSAATSQVYLAAAPQKWRDGQLAEFTAKVSRNLILLMILPMVFFISVIVPLVVPLFGSEWERTGGILVWLLPWYAVRLLSSPISMVMNVVGRQKMMMIMKISALVVRVGAVAIAHYVWGAYLVESLAVASFVVYVVFGVVFLRAAGVSFPQFLGRSV